MKKITKIIALALTLMLALSSFIACKPESDPEGEVTLVVAGDTTEVFTVGISEIEGEKNVLSLVEHLKNEGKLDYKTDSTGYFTEIGSVKQNPDEGKYVGIWTSVESDFDDASIYTTTKTYEGVTVKSSAYGAEKMTLKDGAVIYFSYLIYEF